MQLLAALWQYRDLIYKLASKDIKVRYKHPLLGFLWALLVPTAMIGVFWFIFSVLLESPVQKIPFAVYIATAMFPWMFFQLAVGNSVTCVVDSGSLIKKVYFPRELIPFSVIGANLINFVLSMALLVLFLGFFGIEWSWRLVILPLVILVHLVLTAGLALLVSALQVEFRDVKYIVEIGLVLWFYLVPVFYPISLMEQYSSVVLSLYCLNPMVGIVFLYRWALLPGYGGFLPEAVSVFALTFYTVVTSFLMLAVGLMVFQKRQRNFADWI
ncbi:MAG: ABC transporter permease [Candidatus Omnitrophica bacterium]|nr:ABC transporter permease [Candidatus Omnitrophota bacterium]